jgi:hypothetical protein
MARRSPRWRKPPAKTLSLPTSTLVVECYAIEGKAYVHRPLFGEPATILLIDSTRSVFEAASRTEYGEHWPTEPLPPGDWRVLGWRLPDGTLRHGPHDRVDPELADFVSLPVPNRVLSFGWIPGGRAPGR